jgi:hypothetical protein
LSSPIDFGISFGGLDGAAAQWKSYQSSLESVINSSAQLGTAQNNLGRTMQQSQQSWNSLSGTILQLTGTMQRQQQEIQQLMQAEEQQISILEGAGTSAEAAAQGVEQYTGSLSNLGQQLDTGSQSLNEFNTLQENLAGNTQTSFEKIQQLGAGFGQAAGAITGLIFSAHSLNRAQFQLHRTETMLESARNKLEDQTKRLAAATAKYGSDSEQVASILADMAIQNDKIANTEERLGIVHENFDLQLTTFATTTGPLVISTFSSISQGANSIAEAMGKNPAVIGQFIKSWGGWAAAGAIATAVIVEQIAVLENYRRANEEVTAALASNDFEKAFQTRLKALHFEFDNPIGQAQSFLRNALPEAIRNADAEQREAEKDFMDNREQFRSELDSFMKSPEWIEAMKFPPSLRASIQTDINTFTTLLDPKNFPKYVTDPNTGKFSEDYANTWLEALRKSLGLIKSGLPEIMEERDRILLEGTGAEIASKVLGLPDRAAIQQEIQNYNGDLGAVIVAFTGYRAAQQQGYQGSIDDYIDYIGTLDEGQKKMLKQRATNSDALLKQEEDSWNSFFAIQERAGDNLVLAQTKLENAYLTIGPSIQGVETASDSLVVSLTEQANVIVQKNITSIQNMEKANDQAALSVTELTQKYRDIVMDIQNTEKASDDLVVSLTDQTNAANEAQKQFDELLNTLREAPNLTAALKIETDKDKITKKILDYMPDSVQKDIEVELKMNAKLDVVRDSFEEILALAANDLNYTDAQMDAVVNGAIKYLGEKFPDSPEAQYMQDQLAGTIAGDDTKDKVNNLIRGWNDIDPAKIPVELSFENLSGGNDSSENEVNGIDEDLLGPGYKDGNLKIPIDSVTVQPKTILIDDIPGGKDQINPMASEAEMLKISADIEVVPKSVTMTSLEGEFASTFFGLNGNEPLQIPGPDTSEFMDAMDTVQVAAQDSQEALANLANEGSNSMAMLAKASSKQMNGFENNLGKGAEASFGLQDELANLANEGSSSLSALAKASSKQMNGFVNNVEEGTQAVEDLQSAIDDLHSKKITVEVDATGDGLKFLAKGFHGIVNKPTVMIVGEAGAEQVDVTPTNAAPTGLTADRNLNIVPVMSQSLKQNMGGDSSLDDRVRKALQNIPSEREIIQRVVRHLHIPVKVNINSRTILDIVKEELLDD